MAGNDAVAELEDQTMTNSQNSEVNESDFMELERSAKPDSTQRGTQ